MVKQKCFLPGLYQLRKGKSAGLALKYFYMIRRVGRTLSLTHTLTCPLSPSLSSPLKHTSPVPKGSRCPVPQTHTLSLSLTHTNVLSHVPSFSTLLFPSHTHITSPKRVTMPCSPTTSLEKGAGPTWQPKKNLRFSPPHPPPLHIVCTWTYVCVCVCVCVHIHINTNTTYALFSDMIHSMFV